MTACTDVMIVSIIIHMKDVIEDSISAVKSEIMAVNPLISDRVIEHVNFMSQKEVRTMERSELSVGQTVYIEPVGNAARNGKDIIETKISKIGTKYIETEHFGDRTKFNICDGKEKDTGYGYGYDYILHLTKQEIEDEWEERELMGKFQYGRWTDFHLSLDQLRRIKAIIDERDSNESGTS